VSARGAAVFALASSYGEFINDFVTPFQALPLANPETGVLMTLFSVSMTPNTR
jgi:hypothetical protein